MGPTVHRHNRLRIKDLFSNKITVLHGIGYVLLISMFLTLIPTQAYANVAAMASVDKVLGSLAEVVKDRAKSVATRAIVQNLKNELCDGKEIKIEERTFYLGGKETCKGDIDKSDCNSDDLFVNTCRFMEPDYGMSLTDPYLLKTLSRDIVGFAIRLSSYKLSDKQFQELNLGPFEDFVHGVMEDMVKGRTDLGSLTRKVGDLVDSYESSDKYSANILKEISELDEFMPLLEEVRNAVKGKPITLDQSLESDTIPSCYGGIISDKTVSNKIIKTITINQQEDFDVKEYIESDCFKMLFGDKQYYENFVDVRVKPCSSIYTEDKLIKDCRIAQLAFRLRVPLEKIFAKTDENEKAYIGTTEEAKTDLRNIVYVLEESEIYVEAMKGLGADTGKFEKFSSQVKDKLTKEWSTRQAINDSLVLVASIAQALVHEREKAIDWLKILQKDMSKISRKIAKGEIPKLYEISDTESLRWLNRNKWDPYTKKMRKKFKHLLTRLWILQYKENIKSEKEKIEQIVKVFETISTHIRSYDESELNLSVMVGQISSLMNEIAKSMPQSEMEVFVSSLDEFVKILDYAKRKDWIGLGIEVSDELMKHKGLKNSPKNALRFARTLLSMYQAESADDAKALFQSILEDEASRERRYNADKLAIDVGALVGMRGGFVRQKWDLDSNVTDHDANSASYGIFAPFGIMGTYGRLGLMAYPVDLGGYLSGTSDNDTPEVRVQDALHSGGAIYYRHWNDLPLVFGASADYKQRHGDDDTSEFRASGFITLELPLFIIR